MSNTAVKHVYRRQLLGNPYISMCTLYKGGDPFNWLGYRCCPTRFLKNSILALLCIFYTVSHQESHLKDICEILC